MPIDPCAVSRTSDRDEVRFSREEACLRQAIANAGTSLTRLLGAHAAIVGMDRSPTGMAVGLK